MNLSININGIEYSVSEYTKQDFIDMVVYGEHTVGDLRRATTELPLSIFNPTKGKELEFIDEKVEAIISDELDVLNELINNHDEDFAEACIEYANGGSLEDAVDHYIGQYDSAKDYCMEIFMVGLEDMPKDIIQYIDWDAVWADYCHDVTEINGYYFNS